MVVAVLLQGCVAGFVGITVLSKPPVIDPADAGLQEVVTGVRLGVIDGQASQYVEQYLAKVFSKKMEEEKIFKQVHYPINGDESVIFEVGASSPRYVESAGNMAKGGLCGATLFVACLPVTKEYEFNVEVRAIGWPVGTTIGYYRTTGRARLRFGLMLELQANKEGKETAMTAAFDQVINGIKQDRAKYLSGLPAPAVP